MMGSTIPIDFLCFANRSSEQHIVQSLLVFKNKVPIGTLPMIKLRHLPTKGSFTPHAFDACGCGRQVRCIKIELFLIFAATHTSAAPAS